MALYTRRVRSNMRVYQSALSAKPIPHILIEYPRVSSRCANRPDIWEWRTARAVEIS
jgi:hypothetical protein